MNNTTGTNTDPDNVVEPDDEDGEDFCDVSTLISIIQAISDDVNGVIFYQDPSTKNNSSSITFDELRVEAERAIQDILMTRSPTAKLAAAAVVLQASKSKVKSSSSSLTTTTTAKQPPRTEDDEGGKHHHEKTKRDNNGMVGLTREQIVAKLATPSGSSPDTLDPSSDSDELVTASDDMTDDEIASASPTPTLPSSSSPQTIGVMAMDDPKLIQILQTNVVNKGQSVIAQLTFVNSPNRPATPTGPTPVIPSTTDSSRPVADKSLGLFFWIILGSVVAIVGVW